MKKRRTENPKIYLAIDNCFASKRWTHPFEWMRIVQEIGLKYIEASADTECDPLYLGEAFINDWVWDVKQQCEKTGCIIKNLYSGHGTYATSGLSHYDRRVIERFRDSWMKAQMDTAQKLSAGFGFFAHGFDEELLQDNTIYEAKLNELYDTLAELAIYAKHIGISYVSIEQMYSPHQPPWTLNDMSQLFREVYKRSGAPFYTTLDLGHMNGQQYFVKPTKPMVTKWLDLARTGKKPHGIWLGSEYAHNIFNQAAMSLINPKQALDLIMEDISVHPHLFSEPRDWNINEWVGRFGCYAPIIHLQQNDGKSSPHWPFSNEYNEKGIIKAEEIIKALGNAFCQPEDAKMPPKCTEIVLTLEPFIGTAGNTYDLRENLALSVEYWRKWVPRDGMLLSEVLDNASLSLCNDTDRI